MRIASLHLRAYGPFDGAVLDFDSPPAGLQIVYGPNERGKSTALRGLASLLFGIAAQSADRFDRDYAAMRVGAVLVDGNGRRALMRRKAQRGTLFEFDEASGDERADRPIEQSVLAAMLGGVDERMFAMMYGIGHQQLREGGKALLDGDSELGAAIFEAASGVQHVRRVASRFDEAAQELFQPRARVKKLNAALGELAERQAAARLVGMRPREWQARQQELQRADEALRQATGVLRERRVRLARIERLQALLPQIAACRELERTLAETAAVPELAADAATRLASALDLAEQAARRLAADEAQLTDIRQRLEGLVASQPHLDAAAQIVQLAGRIPDAAGAAIELHELRSAALQAAYELAARIAAIRGDAIAPDAPLDALRAQAADTLPGRAAVAEIRALLDLRARLEARRGDALEAVARGERQLHEARAALAKAPPERDLSALQAVFAAALARGDLEQQAGQARARLAATDTQLLREARRLGGASIDALASLRALPDSIAEGIRTELRAIGQQLAELQAESRQPALDLPLREAERRRLADGPQLVTRELLADARERRDRIVAQWRAGTAPADGHLEQASRHADSLADARFADAARVGEYESLGIRIEQIRAMLAALAERRRALESRRDALRERWTAELAARGLPVCEPDDHAGWAAEHLRFLQAVQAREAQAAELAALDAAVADHLRLLRQACADAGVDCPSLSSLASMLAHLRVVLEQAARDAAERSTRIADVDRAAAALRTDRASLAAIDAELAARAGPWQRLARMLHLPEDTGVAQADARLAELDDLKEAVDALDAARQGLELARNRVDAFRADAGRLAAALGETPPAPGDDIGWVERCQARLTESRRMQHELLKLNGEAASLRGAIAGHRRQQADAQQAVESLRQQAGASDLAALQRAIDDCSRRRAARDALQRQQAMIREIAASPDADLLAEAAGADPDALAAEHAALVSAIEQAERDEKAAIEACTRARAAFDQVDGDASAAEAAEAVRERLAAVRRMALDYARLRLARDLLEESIQRYQQRAQGPLLAAAERWFARITGDGWRALKPDWRDDRQILLAQRADGIELPVEALSEGTADQLYLALRLAAIEVRLDSAEPVPLLLDDVLMTFDDERAARTLAGLAELGRRNQVIYFTHHRHLADLARSTLPPADVAVSTLERSRVTG